MHHKIYAWLVNRQPGICERYHRVHDNAHGLRRALTWVYLLVLNFAFYVLRIKSIGKTAESDSYENKKLPVNVSESEANRMANLGVTVENIVSEAMKYDIVSFDVFDTLIFRPLSAPTDAFYLIGGEIGISDFKNARITAEWQARETCRKANGHTEVSLSDIWECLSEELGCDAKQGAMLEQSMEKQLCYANPFMLEVWQRLMAAGKQVIITSDMYLPKETIVSIVEKSGFTGASEYYISCEYGLNKATGSLYEHVKSRHKDKTMIHIGDNLHSDVKMAKKHGLASFCYPNVNRKSMEYRAYDMSCMVGSAYRGLVNNHLYSFLDRYSLDYEYGFIYGGLFVLGYCQFIHEYCENHSVDKILFLSRDGDILKQVYERLFPSANTEYVYWSRNAATKLMAKYDRRDFFRRFIYHKRNQGYVISDILESMELSSLGDRLTGLSLSDVLTDKNCDTLKDFFIANWDAVLESYEVSQQAAKEYYSGILKDANKAVAVDIGWAGSGALALSCLFEKEWNIPCELTGIVAGTNTIHNREPDTSEPFLQGGRLVAYLYSQRHNRDLLKKHNLNKDYNVYWELLLSSPTPQFVGFDRDTSGNVKLKFGKCDANTEGICDIQKGILDFVDSYVSHFSKFPYMFHISGRDAYAPMLVAASNEEKYLKEVARRFSLQINVV